MLSSIFGSSSDSKKSWKEHVVPIDQYPGRTLTYTDCFSWLEQKVIVLLQKFHDPQVGTVRYIGTDETGKLCAGIEFINNVGGMSGKVQGQKLFKCKPGHGLVIPVEYVRLLSGHEGLVMSNGHSSSIPQSASAPSSLNGSSSSSNIQIPIEKYISLTLPELKVGDNVVWLGAASPQTGIVRWIGKLMGEATVKVWVEMDDYMGNGTVAMDLGTKFGCAPGRGKFIPADELILLENFVPSEDQSDSPAPPSAVVQSITPACDILTERPIEQLPIPSNVGQECNLIDFSDLEDITFNIKPDPVVGAFGKPEELMDTDTSTSSSEQTSNNIGSKDLQLFLMPQQNIDTGPTAPSLTPDDGLPPYNEINNLSYGWKKVDVNGNVPVVVPSSSSSQNNLPLMPKLSFPLVNELDEDYLPAFIIPSIDIVDFFRSTGPKGIQGKRNSCYIDVVLFSMFAFCDAFDPYFLFKDNLFNKFPDNSLTKTAKKVLAEQIVNPLRQNFYCPATGVNSLRELMLPFSDKLDGAFMDIEEFMHIMFDKLFRLREFIVYDNGVKDYLHQVNLGDHNLPPVMTLKQCLELSFKDYNLKLNTVPSPAFIIEIPRHHSGIIQSTTIIPNLSLNLDTLMTEGETRPSCSIVMNLVAVVCIHEFHFVTFVRTGKGALSHWVLFDSNPSEEKPKVEIVTNMGEHLERLEHQTLTQNPLKVAEYKHQLPPHVKRLLSDIYVCIYAIQ